MASSLQDKSEANWRLAEQLLEQGHIDAACNRFYYSVYQVVATHMRLTRPENYPEGKEITHREAITHVGGEKLGRSREFGRSMGELFILRSVADYKPEPVEVEKLRSMISVASTIVRHHRDMILKFQKSDKA